MGSRQYASRFPFPVPCFRLALAPLYALIIGALVRLAFLLQGDFPLTDGGLFYLMAQELQQARYALPMYTAYNGAGIPFAYPPLGLYLAALLADLGPWTLLDVFRFLPLVCNLLSIAAFYRLARALLPSRATAEFAVLAFALLPRAFSSLIMGGGIARAPGFLFAILALQQGYQLYVQRRKRHLCSTAILAACACLCHLEMGLLVAYTMVLFFLARGRQRTGAVHSLLVAVGTLALAMPWWGMVLIRHGVTPLIAAAQAGEPAGVGLAWLGTLSLTAEPYFPLLGALALLGLLVCLRERRFLLPAWLLIIFCLDARKALTVATLPLALLGGIGLSQALLPLLRQTAGEATAPPQTPPSRWLTTAVLLFLLFYASLSASMARQLDLVPLSPEERQAMQWVSENTPADAAFLVIAPEPWATDRSSEWFPVLAGRVSVATPQGYEWLGRDAYWRQIARHRAAQACAYQGADCLAAWAREARVSFTHLYVAKRQTHTEPSDPAGVLRRDLARDPRFRLIYDGPGATVYRLLI